MIKISKFYFIEEWKWSSLPYPCPITAPSLPHHQHVAFGHITAQLPKKGGHPWTGSSRELIPNWISVQLKSFLVYPKLIGFALMVMDELLHTKRSR